tara:strand:- start:193 stop:624 length:432 start_codon:yes stop_codon:yes gene_type:complete
MAATNTSSKRALATRKLLAQITKKQPGKGAALIDKLLNNAHADLDSIEADERKTGANTVLKLLDRVMPKESGPLVNINNNKLAFNGKSADDVLMKLGEFMADRQSKIEAIESREQNRELEIVQPPKKSPKLPANSPLSPNPPE